MLNPQLKKIFLDLIQIEGISHNEKNVAAYIQSFCEDRNLNYSTDNSAEKTESNTDNIIVKHGNGGDTVLLSHMDTARSTKGVKPISHEDRITSDGSTVLGVDNRCGVAILLFLLAQVSEDKESFLPFTAAFTTCEETTLNGSLHLGINGNINQGFVFDSYLQAGKFVNQSFGASNFYATFYGKSAHAGISPEDGINALKAASDAVSKITLGRVNENTTVNIGQFNCESATNVIPDKVTIAGEVRSITEVEVERCLKEIKRIFETSAKNIKSNIKFKTNWAFKPYQIDESKSVFKRISKSIENVGLKPNAEKSWGGSDANSLNARKIDSVNIGIGAQNPHSNEEYILYSDFQKAFEIAVELVKRNS